MNTLKKICFALVLPMAIVFFSGCLKKGKEDPLISLHSRDGRIANEWKLKSAEATDTYVSNGNTPLSVA